MPARRRRRQRQWRTSRRLTAPPPPSSPKRHVQPRRRRPRQPRGDGHQVRPRYALPVHSEQLITRADPHPSSAGLPACTFNPFPVATIATRTGAPPAPYPATPPAAEGWGAADACADTGPGRSWPRQFQGAHRSNRAAARRRRKTGRSGRSGTHDAPNTPRPSPGFPFPPPPPQRAVGHRLVAAATAHPPSQRRRRPLGRLPVELRQQAPPPSQNHLYGRVVNMTKSCRISAKKIFQVSPAGGRRQPAKDDAPTFDRVHIVSRPGERHIYVQ